MTIVVFFLFVLLFSYFSVLAWLALGFIKTPSLQSRQVKTDFISIIICARNEETHVSACLNTIFSQDYPIEKIKIIFVNDASTDNTLALAEDLLKASGINYRIISNTERKGKKKSILRAMEFVESMHIVTRDADTYTISNQWLNLINTCYAESRADMIIGPIAIKEGKGLHWALQAIENNILAVISCGASFYRKAFLSSGANLSFTKKLFQNTGSYASHLHIESGDDVLFLQESRKTETNKIVYLKSADALVYTYACQGFRQLVHQKIRWAAKFKVNADKLNLLLALLVFLVNAGWLFFVVSIFVNATYLVFGLTFIFLKLLIDLMLLILASQFIKTRNLIIYSLPALFIYPFYACVIALLSVFGPYKWNS
jgi:poly-beta-1,6-N-acetyl-D-glucosamine synthase